MLRTGFALLILLNLFFLSGCGTDKINQVRVTEAWHQPLRVPVIYMVHAGDRLYSIAWMYGLDYKQIAKDNHLKPPYKIEVGQRLRLRPQSSAWVAPKKVVTKPAYTAARRPAPKAQTNAVNKPSNKQAEITAPPPVTTTTLTATPPLGAVSKIAGITWTWPAQGKIINGFAPTNLNRGVDIAGKLGNPVLAAAAGRVVYAGNGLRGYGQLIIIKHNDTYLSAYAHNQTLLVKEGQNVRIGQRIATLGASEAKSPMLHFEIRQNGKPVDPLKYLPTR